MREEFESLMRARLDQLKAEIAELVKSADRAETSLELEYYTLLEEAQVKLEAAEQKFELFREVHDDQWETFKTDLELSWKSLRELIKGITAP